MFYFSVLKECIPMFELMTEKILLSTMTVQHYKELHRWKVSAFCAHCHIWL